MTKIKKNIFINEKRPHDSGIKHVSGKANYTDDLPELPGTLYGAIGWSKRAYAIIKKINLNEVIKSDGVVAVVTAKDIKGRNKIKVSEMLLDVPKTEATPEIRVDCPDNRKFEIVRELTESFRKKYDVIDIDGARVNFGEGWALIRASNTQPVIVFRFEANNAGRLAEIISIVRKAVSKYEPIFTLSQELC